MVTPLVLSVAASLKAPAEAAEVPPLYLPSEVSLENYDRLWNYGSRLPHYLGNSLFTAFMTIVMTLLLTVPAGYGLARFPIPGKEFIFVLLLLALIIPYQALLTPVFLMFSTLGLTNNLLGLAIVHTTIQLPFSLYIMRNAFEAVPRELEEAALVDGANSWQILRRVFLPSMVPAVITVTLFAFVTSWNEFLGALVMMTNDSDLTLPWSWPHPECHQPRQYRLGDAPGGGHHRRDSVRRGLPAPPALLRVRPAQWCGEIGSSSDRRTAFGAPRPGVLTAHGRAAHSHHRSR